MIHYGSYGWLTPCLAFLAGTAAIAPAVRRAREDDLTPASAQLDLRPLQRGRRL